MTRRAVLAACTVAFATAAHAETTVWTHAIAGDADDVARAAYARALRDGDEHALQANACMVSENERKRQVQLSLDSYRKAAVARPSEGEPHYRLATVMDSFFVCGQSAQKERDDECQQETNLCTATTFATYAPQEVAEIDAFEARAPLDPRLTVVGGISSLLFERAIIRTKLATPAQLEGAAHDYETIIARASDQVGEAVVSNLAETYMMLGRLDDAIDRYVEADSHGSSEAKFGLAVALDRNGQTDRAAATIRSIGDDMIVQFHVRVSNGQTFFVPFGEVFYYKALIEESRGRDMTALELWRAYVKSNAHPQYQPGAKAHIAAILKRLATRPVLRTPAEDPEHAEW